MGGSRYHSEITMEVGGRVQVSLRDNYGSGWVGPGLTRDNYGSG